MGAWRRVAAVCCLGLGPLSAVSGRRLDGSGQGDARGGGAAALLERGGAGLAAASSAAALGETERAAGPYFDKDGFQKMLQRLQAHQVSGPGACGRPVPARVVLREELLNSMFADLESHFRFGPLSSNRSGVYSISDALEEILVPKGLVLLRVGQTQGPFSSVQEVAAAWKPDLPQQGVVAWLTGMLGFGSSPSLELQLEFEAGLDLRSCWGELTDMQGRPVCGSEAMDDLASKLSIMQAAERDSAGQSGATIITNLKNFVLKSVSAEEYELMADVMPLIQKSIEDRYEKFGGCWSTGLAPFCAALVEPTLGEDGSFDPDSAVYWVITREVALGEPYRRMPRSRVNWYDLKGPEFTGWSDGKTMVSKEYPWIATLLGIKPTTWKHKDLGFEKRFDRRFSSGIGLKTCGARDAKLTLVSDSLMLRDNDMTDYSLFLNLYGSRGDEGCVCDRHTKPTFPIVLQVEKPRPMTLAVGVIDYIERRVNMNYLGASFSTMKPAREFSALWTSMFGQYFRVPRMACVGQDTSSKAVAGCQHVEVVRKGDRVMSLTNWWEHDGTRGREVVNETYASFVLPWVSAGDEGTAEQVLETSALVRFDGDGDHPGQGLQREISFADLVAVPREWA